MAKLIDPDDGVAVQPAKRKHHFALFPLLIMTVLGLAVYLWPPYTADVSPLVKPPVAEAGAPVPQTIVTVAQGQAVGDEAYWEGFRLNRGWYLAENHIGDQPLEYGLSADVTNTMDVPDVARIMVQVRVGERNAETLYCQATLGAGETKPFSCQPSAHAQYTSRWGRITISAL